MYGLSIAPGSYGTDRFDRMVALAREGEAAGFETVWTSELYNRSATIPMAVLARETETIRIGCNIGYGVGRTPLVWAAEARDLDALSGGRVTIGLGNGTPGMMENWHGVSGATPAVRMEELVEVLRKLWRLHEGPVHHEGPFYRVHVEPTSVTAPPVQEHLPIWTAGVNPRMIRAAGRVSDGLVGHPMCTAAYVDSVVRPALLTGARSVGRDVNDISVMGILMCAVDDDVETARRRIALAIAEYAASRVYDRLFDLHGWADAQLEIRAAAKRRDVEALVRAVPDDAIDAIAVACRPDELAAQVARHAETYDHLALVAPAWGLHPSEAEEATRRIVSGIRLSGSPPADHPESHPVHDLVRSTT